MALEIMKQKLYQLEIDKKKEKELLQRKAQVSTGDRSEKIRTYNFPQDRVTDHRLGKTTYGI